MNGPSISPHTHNQIHTNSPDGVYSGDSIPYIFEKTKNIWNFQNSLPFFVCFASWHPTGHAES